MQKRKKKPAGPASASGTDSSSEISIAEMLWSSLMVKYPEHVHALGMMSIEIAEMERHLARLLGRLIGDQIDIAEAIYFTPKAAIPRIEFLANLAPLVLAKNKPKLAAVMDVAAKAAKLMGKRHNLIHNRFGVDGGSVMTIRYEKGIPTQEPVPLKKITGLVQQIRRLNVILIDLTDYGLSGNWLES